jgi:hypothetical protein
MVAATVMKLFDSKGLARNRHVLACQRYLVLDAITGLNRGSRGFWARLVTCAEATIFRKL